MNHQVEIQYPSKRFAQISADWGMLSLAFGLVVLKSIWDSYLIDGIDQEAFVAFGYLFPVILFFNVVSNALVNSVNATFSMAPWLEKSAIDSRLFSGFSLLSIVVGIVIVVFVLLLEPLLVRGIADASYATHMQAFHSALIYWIPVQFLASYWLCLLRGIGRHKLVAWLLLVSNVIGAGITHYLLNHQSFIDMTSPLQAICYSNLCVFLVVSIGSWLLVLQKLRMTTKVKLSNTAITTNTFKVFSATIAANFSAVLFYFCFIDALNSQGKEIAEATVYLVRIEQLILTIYGAFVAITIPLLSQMLGQKIINLTLQQALRFGRILLSAGIIIVLFFGLVLSVVFIFQLGKITTQPTVVMLAAFWLLGLSVQGAGIYFFQIINVLLKPGVAAKVNFYRFVLLGIPGVYGIGYVFGAVGILAFLALLHWCSFLLIFHSFKKIWRSKYADQQLWQLAGN